MKSLIFIISSLMIVSLSFGQEDSAIVTMGKTRNLPMRNAVVYKQNLFAGPGPEYDWVPSVEIVSEKDSVFATVDLKVENFKQAGSMFAVSLTDNYGNHFDYSGLKKISVIIGEKVPKGYLIGLASQKKNLYFSVNLVMSDKHLRKLTQDKIWKLIKDE